MLSKNQIKKLRGLQRKKERNNSGLYVVEGKKVATERPIWTFNADKSLKSLTCNCYGEEFVMF